MSAAVVDRPRTKSEPAGVREQTVWACLDAIAELALQVDALRRRVQLLEEGVER